VPEAPPQVEPSSLAVRLDVMSKAIFQTGISWRVVEAKWDGTRAALRDFDPRWLASLTPDEMDELARDTRLIRNRRKIEAISQNAATMLALEREHGGFEKYLASFPDYPSLARDVRKRFRFLGEMGIYYWLYCTKHPVPEYHDVFPDRRHGS
jgi:3-methyladenine DNA glycosylase Tag